MTSKRLVNTHFTSLFLFQKPECDTSGLLSKVLSFPVPSADLVPVCGFEVGFMQHDDEF